MKLLKSMIVFAAFAFSSVSFAGAGKSATSMSGHTGPSYNTKGHASCTAQSGTNLSTPLLQQPQQQVDDTEAQKQVAEALGSGTGS